MDFLSDRSVPDWLVPKLAGIIEETDAAYGVDSAPVSSQNLVEIGYSDLAFEALVYAGVPTSLALDYVLEAADEVGADRAIAFELIVWSMEPETWLME